MSRCVSWIGHCCHSFWVICNSLAWLRHALTFQRFLKLTTCRWMSDGLTTALMKSSEKCSVNKCTDNIYLSTSQLTWTTSSILVAAMWFQRTPFMCLKNTQFCCIKSQGPRARTSIALWKIYDQPAREEWHSWWSTSKWYTLSLHRLATVQLRTAVKASNCRRSTCGIQMEKLSRLWSRSMRSRLCRNRFHPTSNLSPSTSGTTPWHLRAK